MTRTIAEQQNTSTSKASGKCISHLRLFLFSSCAISFDRRDSLCETGSRCAAASELGASKGCGDAEDGSKMQEIFDELYTHSVLDSSPGGGGGIFVFERVFRGGGGTCGGLLAGAHLFFLLAVASPP